MTPKPSLLNKYLKSAKSLSEGSVTLMREYCLVSASERVVTFMAAPGMGQKQIVQSAACFYI